MRCPNCSFENSPEAHFCEECGQPFERMCRRCGQPIPPSARFCRNCGANLVQEPPLARAAQAVQSENLQALRRSAPAEMASRILAERRGGEGERKLVTTLFADMVASTSLAEKMDPEDWRSIVLGFHERVSRAIYQYEGVIAQLLGDGVLAFFGAPLAHEDDAERAVRSALKILAEVDDYSRSLAAETDLSGLRVRVGIHTGMVVVGAIGTDLHMEYLAIGDTVNLAARLESAAEPSTAWLSESTSRMVEGLFELEDQGSFGVKGRTEPVHAYRVLGPRKGSTRLHGISGMSSQLVGRQREFSTLIQVIQDLKAGRGSTVAIIGEAGLGKSRLIAEWRKATLAMGNGVRWFESRCLSYGMATAHHLSTDILRGLIGVTSESGVQETQEALRAHVSRYLPEPATSEVYPYLGRLLEVPLEEEMAQRVRYLDGPALQAQYVAAFRKLLREMARQAPLVLVCEDIHWADPSSVQLGRQIIPIAAENPVVFTFVTRPDRDSPGWKLVEQAREQGGVGGIDLYLAPLTEADSEALVANLLRGHQLPEEIRDLILAKSEGNPFFLEEVIRMLIDRHDLDHQDGRWILAREIDRVEIPATVQGVLAARIDRLPPEVKRSLQVASVIGRQFEVGVLKQVLARLEGK